ncbi:alpha/beta fold hydrolase [Deefgea salmonis]|uniref:Alpha/beta hydrolase n=1 Tax=Deefgea salmonis TaxID=2875502 RepID=A0ABS8BMN4_9NEIS|nr:alpha/beta hydrolase [Deefgea salmonis]MCB5196761.1 alpha/beta hydrolase [Deefgea salmonis]
MKNWVLLRGLMRETRHWGDFAQQLQQQYPQDRIIMLDWPGNGQLNAQISPNRIEQMVQYLRQTLIEQGHQAPYHVIALSLGAMVAIAWAQQAPNELASATLINTSLRPFNRFYQRLRPRNYPQLLRLLFSTAAQQEQIILQLTSNTSIRSQAQLLPQWIAYQQQYPIRRSNILRQLFAALRYRSRLNCPAVPLQLLASQCDQLVSAQCSQTLAQRWQIPLYRHPSAGHDLPLDDAAWVLAHLQLGQPT